MFFEPCHGPASADDGSSGASGISSGASSLPPSGCTRNGSCRVRDQMAGSFAFPPSTSSGMPSATRLSRAARSPAPMRSNLAASITIRLGAVISSRGASVRVISRPSVTCQSSSAPLPAISSLSTRRSNEGAPKRPTTCNGTGSCTVNGIGPSAMTLSLAPSRRALSTTRSATGGIHSTVSVPVPLAWAMRWPFSASSSRRASNLSSRSTRRVNRRPSATWFGKSRRSAPPLGACQVSGRAGKSFHAAARRPLPSRRRAFTPSSEMGGAAGSMASVRPASPGTRRSAANRPRLIAATSTSKASSHWRRRRYSAALTRPARAMAPMSRFWFMVRQPHASCARMASQLSLSPAAVPGRRRRQCAARRAIPDGRRCSRRPRPGSRAGRPGAARRP